jgi:chitinase
MRRFTRLMTAVLAVTLAVSSGCSSGSGGGGSACVQVPPVASAGATQIVPKNTMVQLLGSAAGASASAKYQWQLVAAPVGSAAQLSSASSAGASFKPDVAGVYVAALTVTDGCATSAVDKVAVVATDSQPVAVTGPDQTVEPGDTVVLDGASSGDPDRDAISYSWSLVTRPYGSVAVLAAPTSAKPTFVADAPGTYVALLTVSDGASTSEPATTVIQAGAPGPGCSGVLPIASAGADQTMSYPGYVSLSASGSRPNGGTGVTFRWWLATVPSGSPAAISWPNDASTGFFTDRAGVYVVALVVNDGCADSAPAFVRITVPNVPPTVSLYVYGANSIPFGVPLQVSAYGSDSNGGSLTYSWTMVSRPQGSTAALTNATAQSPSFTPDLEGQYVLSVVASDGKLSSTPATATITAVNSAPVASAGADAAGAIGVPVALDGSASTDPNGTALTYAWTLAAPGGSAATLVAPTTAHPSFTPDVAGVYAATLVASDGVKSASSKVNVSVWPAITRVPYQVVDAGYSSVLDELVLVTASPPVLVLHDPRTHVEKTVALSAAPTSVSVSPNGLSAAVGHANAITFVDLSSATPVATRFPVNGTATSVAIADDGEVYAVSSSSTGRMQIASLSTATGVERDALSTSSAPATVRVRSGAPELYVSGGNYGSLLGYDVSSDVPMLVSMSNYACGGTFWTTSAGDRLITHCGAVLRASSSPVDDLTSIGALATTTTYSTSLRHASDSSARGELSCVASNDSYSYYSDDRTLRRYSTADLSLRESAVFPVDPSGPTPWRGRYVFYRSDGTERYVVMQLDAGVPAGAFGIATF